MQYDAFISYRRNNGFLMANYIYEHLKGEKVSCFLDTMELGAEDFHEKILKEVIPNTQYFILILAPGVLDNCTEKGDWLRREIYTAQKNKATIIKVMYNGFTWPKEKAKSFPDYIKKIDKLNGIEVNQYSLGDLTGNLLNFMPSVKRKPSPKKTNLYVPSTDLTVIDTFLKGSDLNSILSKYGFRVEEQPYNWDDTILKDLATGKLDIAIYNKESCINYNASNEGRISIVRDICSSVGGRNFYILASKRGKWKNMTLEEFKESLNSDTTIAVSKNTDRFANLLYILDMTEGELRKQRGVKIVDYTAQRGLGILDVDPDILLVAGQDVRYLAEWTGKYTEIISYDDFPKEKKDFFYRNSINSLLIGPSGREKLSGFDLDDLGREIMLNFYRNAIDPETWKPIREKLSKSLNQICGDEEARDYIVNKIIFETYRLI